MDMHIPIRLMSLVVSLLLRTICLPLLHITKTTIPRRKHVVRVRCAPIPVHTTSSHQRCGRICKFRTFFYGQKCSHVIFSVPNLLRTKCTVLLIPLKGSSRNESTTLIALLFLLLYIFSTGGPTRHPLSIRQICSLNTLPHHSRELSTSYAPY